MWKVVAIGAIIHCLFGESVTQNATSTAEFGPTTPTRMRTANWGNEAKTRVATSDELHSALADAVEGSVIELAEGVYLGPFVLRQDGVTVRGQGNGSIIQPKTGSRPGRKGKGVLDISGNNCEVQNLKMVSEIEFTYGVNITGSGNRLTNISITEYTRGIRISGNGNILSNITIQYMRGGFYTYFTFVVVGSNNSVSSMDCDNCTNGISVAGDNNSFHLVQMRNTVKPIYYCGILIVRGSGNLVDVFRGQGDRVVLRSKSSNAVLRDVVCGMVGVYGSGHTLFNVDAGVEIAVRGSGHQITKSTATKLRNEGANVTISQSKFQSEE